MEACDGPGRAAQGEIARMHAFERYGQGVTVRGLRTRARTSWYVSVNRVVGRIEVRAGERCADARCAAAGGDTMIIGNSYTQIRARAPALQVPRESKSRHGQFQVVEKPTRRSLLAHQEGT